MSFTNDPINNPIDEIRLMVDIDPYDELLSDQVYKYLYYQNNTKRKAAVEALKFIVNMLASCVTEKAGGLFVKDSERFEQYSKLLSRYTKDPTFSLLAPAMPYAGGISITDMENNEGSLDNRLNKSTIDSISDIKFP